MTHSPSLLAVLLLVIAGAILAQPASAQFGKRLKEAATSRAQTKAVQTVLGTDSQAATSADDASPTEADAPVSPASVSSSGASVPKPGEGAWANYDFVPGDRVLFVDDFSADRVGNFPQRLTFVSGNQEIVDWNGARYLRATSHTSVFTVPLPEVLPDRFTLEVDVAPLSSGWNQELTVGDPAAGASALVVFGYDRVGINANRTAGGSAQTVPNPAIRDQVFTLRVLADGDYVKVYQNEHRVANVPNARLGRSNRIQFTLRGTEEKPALLTNLRVRAGGGPLYDALAAEGRVAIQGLYFDPASDVLRPESTPTLTELGALLTTHASLALLIEGHTDATGSADANRALSERRAAAVKAYLVATHGIDAARLDVAGYGPDRPVASNDTPEGRQQNRRVEITLR